MQTVEVHDDQHDSEHNISELVFEEYNSSKQVRLPVSNATQYNFIEENKMFDSKKDKESSKDDHMNKSYS